MMMSDMTCLVLGGHVDHKLCLLELLAAYQTVVKKTLERVNILQERDLLLYPKRGQGLRPKLKQRPGK